jgi:hypothetical protein
LFAAGSPHSETVDDGYIRYDALFLEIVSYHISYRVNDLSRQEWENLTDIPVQIAKRFLE